MTGSSRIVVLQVPPFDRDRTLGGAEVIAAQFVAALAAEHQVTVLSGYHTRTATDVRTADDGVLVLNAFPIDEHVRSKGNIRPCFTDRASESVAQADLVVTVERSLAGPSRVPRVVTLGGVAYPHTIDLLRHREWDRLVVPSPFVSRQVAEHIGGAKGVDVIDNGIDTMLFQPSGTRRKPGPVRLLLPSRPVTDKGFHAAVALVEALRESGLPTTLVCVDQPDGLDGVGCLPDVLGASSGRVEVRPWQPRRSMPALYDEADLTLCLSEVPEGFGLTVVESIACGTPVLATRSGNLARILPPGCGVHWVDAATSPETWTPAAREALDHGPGQALHCGRPRVEQTYSSERMMRDFVRLVNSLLPESGHG